MTHRAVIWSAVSMFALLLIGCSIATVGYFVNQAQTQNNRHHDACLFAQSIYDNQIKYTRFLSDEFHASPAQLAAGLIDLHRALGPRPKC